MSAKEDASFMGNAMLMAEAHGMTLVVNPDSTIDLRHKFRAGHPSRRPQADIDTFMEFIDRNKHRLRSAAGVQPKMEPVVEDAQRLLGWIKSMLNFPDCRIGKAGEAVQLHQRSRRLIEDYEPTEAWVLAAFRFYKLVVQHDSWRTANT